MFGIKIKNKVSFRESIRYIANSLIRIASDGNGNVIGISSSVACEKEKFGICNVISQEIKSKGLSAKVMNAEDEKFNNISNLENLLKEEKDKNDVVIVNIPPIPFVADGVEYAKRCDRVLLLEKYMYSTYKDYEESLIRLKAYEVKLEGIITYGD